MAKTYTKTQVEATEAILLISKADRILANDRLKTRDNTEIRTKPPDSKALTVKVPVQSEFIAHDAVAVSLANIPTMPLLSFGRGSDLVVLLPAQPIWRTTTRGGS